MQIMFLQQRYFFSYIPDLNQRLCETYEKHCLVFPRKTGNNPNLCEFNIQVISLAPELHNLRVNQLFWT